MQIPSLNEKLNPDHLQFLTAFTKDCRKSIISMVKNSQSGHPGGSLSSLDYLAVLYSLIISQTGEDVIVSNGHISPAVYSVLAELNYINKEDVIANFRKIGSPFEGHITRHVPGVLYGTGPLGIGVSVASSFALAEKLNKTSKKTFCLFGDGEAQEGQVYEMMHFTAHYKLDNLIAFVDYNNVQLTAGIEEIMPFDIKKTFEASDWEVIEIDAHNYEQIWESLREAYQTKDKPILIFGKSIMGKGVPGMEEEGKIYKSTWHGNAPKPDQADEMLKNLQLTDEEKNLINEFLKQIKWQPPKPEFPTLLSKVEIKTGTPIIYSPETLTDCRTAYGKALLDLAKMNPEILAFSADLRGSVMTKFVAEEIPAQHIECGIAEQHMVSCAGGISLKGFIPFASTFGAFLSSRAKDQARVNDINNTNVKLVATHCGLSVGEDGPTHQAIDDIGSFMGFFNTMICEPADPNHTDRIIRYIASHFGNFYVRMGRHKIPTITKEDSSIFYDENYIFEYGKSDIIREGTDLTLAASGSMVNEAFKAYNLLKTSNPEISIELIALSTPKKFDDAIFESIKKTKKLITVEDHNIYSGLGAALAREIALKQIKLDNFEILGTKEYELSGTVNELYKKASLNAESIAKKCLNLKTP